MPKRIQLPSADELFQLPGAVSGAPEPAPVHQPKPRKKQASSQRAAAAPKVGAAPAAAGKQTRRRRAPAAAVSHLDRVESSLRDLPIDTLIDLRDGLEDLLISERVDAGDLEQLLASIGV